MKVGVVGCGGRMGQLLCAQIKKAEEELVGGTEIEGSPLIGTRLGDGIVYDHIRDLYLKADVVVDFSVPQVSVDNAKVAAELGKALVIGTTGLSAEQQQVIQECSQKAPIVFAPNMSLGVSLLMNLVQKAAEILDEDYDIEIVEMHHRYKKDAPSGTALAFGKAAAAGRKVSLEKAAKLGRMGTNNPRQTGEIGFASLRGGDVAGDHTIVFAGEGERVELTHKASSRLVFAKGAVRAIKWIYGKPAGLYSMQDVLFS
ncbi:MAG: 4-hydroxy-tetrahydrodipicolinate reductase [Alphaproteobacteria bacterium]|nr:4-hydroxy-tetrahydrodipicolinate reductase [Alphaproteobacteria bacterium]